MKQPGRSQSVFLNIPFDHKYEPLAIALIASLIAYGRRPRTVLEILPSQPRLKRLRTLLKACATSVHDLSRIETTLVDGENLPRFNMPFELGLALGIGGGHRALVLEARKYQAQKTLSDINGLDPEAHGNTTDGVLAALGQWFGSSRDNPSLAKVRSIVTRLELAFEEHKRTERIDTLFHARMFNLVTGTAAELVRAEGHPRTRRR